MVRSKLTAYIGFAARARKLKSGDFTCEKLMKQKKVQLMLLDSGVSANTREKYEAMCSAAEIAVSYTHLDVYQRQAITARICWKSLYTIPMAKA